MWTGINFGLASYYRLMGETTTAEAICSAVVTQVYSGGLQFRTPEAITADEHLQGLPLPAGDGDLGAVGYPHQLGQQFLVRIGNDPDG